jgi:hypothetical protein
MEWFYYEKYLRKIILIINAFEVRIANWDKLNGRTLY